VHASRDLVQGQGPVLPGLSDHEQLPTPLLGLAQQVEGVDKVLEPLVGPDRTEEENPGLLT
jgi:hypothetical protein